MKTSGHHHHIVTYTYPTPHKSSLCVCVCSCVCIGETLTVLSVLLTNFKVSGTLLLTTGTLLYVASLEFIPMRIAEMLYSLIGFIFKIVLDLQKK